MVGLCNVDVHGANHFCLRAHHGCFLEHAVDQQMADHPGQKKPHRSGQKRLHWTNLFVSSRPVPVDHAHHGIEWHPNGAVRHAQQPTQRRRGVEFRRDHRLFHLRSIDLISEFLFHWEFIKSLPQFLSLYLTLNIAIVGLAFIFELTRNLILGGQSFGGMFGVVLDTPREIRAEKAAQARQLTFAFAGFSGYTVLLLILVCQRIWRPHAVHRHLGSQ